MHMNDNIIVVFILSMISNISSIKNLNVNNIMCLSGFGPKHTELMRSLFLILSILPIIIILLFIQNKYLKKKVSRINLELKKQHDWLETTLSSINEGVIATDTSGRVAFINGIAKALLGISEKDAKELNVNSIFNIYNEDSRKKEFIPTNEVLNKGNIIEISPNTVLISRDNKIYNIEASISPLRDSKDLIIGMVLIFRDVTEKKDAQMKLGESYQQLEALYGQIAAAEEEIREQYKELQVNEQSLKISEERYRLATVGCNDGIWDYNILTKELFFSDRCKDMLGIKMDKNITHVDKWMSYIYEEDVHNFEQEMESHFNGTQPFFKVEYRIKTDSGELKWFLSRGQAVWNALGKPTRMAGSITDITETKKNEDIIYNMAYYDTLTKLPNKMLLFQSFNSRLENVLLNEKHLAILFIDIDNFKSVNDIVGHQFGDEMLKKIARVYNDMIQEDIHFFHLGGDKFCMVFENDNTLTKVKNIANKILAMSENAIIIKNFEFYISSSIGISLFPEHGTDIQTLIKNAETAMYCVKESGKNNYLIYDENMYIRTLEKLDMEKSLRHAIKNQEFVVYYQPQININSGVVIGMEALVRWKHPKLGFISPMNFIPLAEETGLIIPIGEQILKIVCHQIKEWQNRGFSCVPIAVNISARQFENADLLGTIDKVIEEAGIEPNMLEVEITETIALSDFEFAVKILEGLKHKGIMISLDDFGTGYSSLNYLKKLPINRVKIDKSFVHDLSLGSSEEVIAEAIINIAHRMKLSVVAEGIETEEQLEILKEKGCDIAQGYLFSKPVPKEEAERLLKYD